MFSNQSKGIDTWSINQVSRDSFCFYNWHSQFPCDLVLSTKIVASFCVDIFKKSGTFESFFLFQYILPIF